MNLKDPELTLDNLFYLSKSFQSLDKGFPDANWFKEKEGVDDKTKLH